MPNVRGVEIEPQLQPVDVTYISSYASPNCDIVDPPMDPGLYQVCHTYFIGNAAEKLQPSGTSGGLWQRSHTHNSLPHHRWARAPHETKDRTAQLTGRAVGRRENLLPMINRHLTGPLSHHVVVLRCGAPGHGEWVPRSAVRRCRGRESAASRGGHWTFGKRHGQEAMRRHGLDLWRRVGPQPANDRGILRIVTALKTRGHANKAAA